MLLNYSNSRQHRKSVTDHNDKVTAKLRKLGVDYETLAFGVGIGGCPGGYWIRGQLWVQSISGWSEQSGQKLTPHIHGGLIFFLGRHVYLDITALYRTIIEYLVRQE